MIESEIALLIGVLISLLSGLIGFNCARFIDRKASRDQGLPASELRQLIVEAVHDAVAGRPRASLRGDRVKELHEPNQGLKEGRQSGEEELF